MTILRRYPLVAITVVVGVMGLLLLTSPWHGATAWIVSAYALLIAAWQAVRMIHSLMHGHAGLDILAVTAITAAVAVGEYWAALVVVLMLTSGAALEDFAENRSRRELTALLAQAPQHATRLCVTTDGTEQEEDIPVGDVGVGDILLLRPGAVVPVDSVVLSDRGVFDESSLTGESVPVDRIAGERVSSGAVNGAAAVRVRSLALAADSEYQHIVRLVEQASQSRASVVRLADRYAVPFTILALLVAGTAWVVSGDPVRFAEVLVVATPCPLLIAAPVAFLAGMSRAARFGLIVKGGGTLEQLSRVRAAAFDKTGTLTTGRPSLVRVVAADSFAAPEVLRCAGSAEVYSSHVLAPSVIAAAKADGGTLVAALHAEEHATNGVVATLADGGIVRVGKPAWIADRVGSLPVIPLEAGELAVHVAVNDRYAGAIIMRDQLRPEAADVVTELRANGVENLMLVTGDVAATADPIARGLGITEVHAQCLPADKVRIVADARPRPLIMVGDGLNDAPVLAAADVGFAMGARGATAASESADVVNRFDTLENLPRAIRIGRETVRIALQSIWLGIIISSALMVIAAFGLLPALAGAWLQELVDLIAILGALRAVGPRSERRPRRS